MSQDLLIAVDIGGTHTRMAIFSFVAGRPEQHMMQKYRSRDFANFVTVAQHFLAEWQGEAPTAMAIGVAGPVVQGKVTLTNLDWQLDEVQLAADLGLRRGVYLTNDLAAHAHGLSLLDEAGFLCIQEGEKQGGNLALIAAGTGLGEALVIAHASERICVSSEGGHADFGPNHPDDVLLWEFLRQEYQHISWERVVSGKLGFYNLYRFETMVKGMPVVDELEQACHNGGDLSPPLLQACESEHPTALAVIRMFSRLYGAEAGNLALKGMATGGVYVLGGVSRAFRRWVSSTEFLKGFHEKGRFSPLMARIPVHLVVAEGNGLRGAALFGWQQTKKATA